MITYRKAKRGDEHGIFNLVYELAVYEKAPEAVINTPEQMAIDLFDDRICDAFVAEIDGEMVGMALYYISYSTWRGRSMYLEDLYVKPDQRGKKIGFHLFGLVRQEGIKLLCKRMDWQVLEWNQPAIDFYEQMGAELDPEWINGRLYFD